MERKYDTYQKPRLGGVKSRWVSDWERLQELAEGIARCAREDGKRKYEIIKPWAEEIVDICDNAEYGKHDN